MSLSPVTNMGTVTETDANMRLRLNTKEVIDLVRERHLSLAHKEAVENRCFLSDKRSPWPRKPVFFSSLVRVRICQTDVTPNPLTMLELPL